MKLLAAAAASFVAVLFNGSANALDLHDSLVGDATLSGTVADVLGAAVGDAAATVDDAVRGEATQALDVVSGGAASVQPAEPIAFDQDVRMPLPPSGKLVGVATVNPKPTKGPKCGRKNTPNGCVSEPDETTDFRCIDAVSLLRTDKAQIPVNRNVPAKRLVLYTFRLAKCEGGSRLFARNEQLLRGAQLQTALAAEPQLVSQLRMHGIDVAEVEAALGEPDGILVLSVPE